MNTESIKKGIISGLNSITTPQSLTTQLVTGFINSEYTKETVRKFLLDPVQRKLTPKYKYHGFFDTYIAMYALYELDHEQFFEAFELGDTVKEWFVKYADFRPSDLMANTIPSSDRINSCIMKHDGNLIYIQWKVDDDKYQYYISMYFIGTSVKALQEKIAEGIKRAKYESREGYRLKHKREVPVYTFDSGRPKRSRCTVPNTIIVDHVEKELDTILKSIQLSETISENYELNKTTGILLYGPHGTGKSTLVRYLAMELGRTILLTGADNLEHVIDFVKERGKSSERFIILIEDIDFKFVDRRSSKKDDKNAEMNANTDLLFQILDGVLSENNLVVCATTNYIDRLDPALIRDGRFDYRIEVLGLSYENAVKVCERFDISPDEIKLNEWDTPISPASLQTCILKYKTTVAE